MLPKLGLRAAVLGLAVSAGALIFSAPAGAIQTTTWGIQPAPHDGHARGSLSYPSNGQTVHDSIQVYNLTAEPEVINLSVLAATQVGGAYHYSLSLTGLAGHVTLAGYHVTLPPHQQADIPVTVTLPRHSKVTTLAGIAAEGAPLKRGAVLIEQRLVVLVKATPSTKPALVPDIGLWGPIAAVLLGGVGAFGVIEVRKRRRSPAEAPAARAEPDRAEMAGAR